MNSKNMTLLELRKTYKISQTEMATILGIPLRTYRRYGTDDSYGSRIKRDAFIAKLNNRFEITEEKRSS